ncbi:MAG: tetratricopeptide repeat protein [Candidatus Acidiferrales bacterium]
MKRKFNGSVRWILMAGVLWALCAAPPSWARGRAGAANRNAADVSGLLDAARQQFDQGQYGAALKTLESAQTQNPMSAATYFWMGRAFFEIRDFSNAVAQFQKALSLNADSSEYHQWLGRAFGGKAGKEKSFFVARNAKGQFETAVKLDPSNVAARRDLEDYCMNAPRIVGGSKDEALAQVNAIAAINPVEGHLARAEYDMAILKNPANAENEYQQVLAEKPSGVEPYLEAAAFFGRQNELPQMKDAIDLLAQAHPNDSRVTLYRGIYGVLSRTNLDSAEEDMKSYLASTPERSDWPSHSAARDWLGRLYEEKGNGVMAAEQYRAALQLDPQNQDAQRRLQRLEKAVQ